ncbi:MAG: FtsX-like permease family protein, partial [bacterium]
MARKILFKIGFGYHKAHPLQTLLIIIGIALGVAVVVSIDIANSSVSRSFRLSTESLTGKTTHQIVGSSDGIPQEVFKDLRLKLGHRDNTPVVEGYVQVKELGLRTLKLLGVDPFSELYFRNVLSSKGNSQPVDLLTGLLAEAGRVLISEQLAGKAGLAVGDHLTLLQGGKEIPVMVYGYLQTNDKISQNALSGVIITDISTAQEILQLGDIISRIDLVIADEDADTLRSIAEILPPQTFIVPSEKRSGSIRQMSKSFELNLQAMSLLALLVGMFLIYNTITFSVVQRRKLLGILRALGVTQREIFVMIMGETIILGFIGSLLGLLVGMGLGIGTVKLVSQTISDLYYVLSVNAFSISFVDMLKALGLGLLASFISALFPAIEAVRVTPVGALRRSVLEKYALKIMPALSLAGIVFLLAGGVILRTETRQLVTSFAGLLFIVFGAALLVPFLSQRFIRFWLWVLPPGVGLITKLALRNTMRSLSRTTVSIAALMIAVSVIIGVGIMVESFRFTVVQWLNTTIKADIYLVGVNRAYPNLDPGIPEALKEIPGIREQHLVRAFKINSGRYTGAVMFAQDKEIVKRRWIWKSGTESEIYQQFEKGAVFISETFAWHNKIAQEPGKTLSLMTNQGMHTFPIAGVFRDFSARQGMILIKTRIYRQFWRDDRISGIALMSEPGISSDGLIDRIN